MDKKKLIIIGGGTTGLMAAMELSDLYEITIIEAQAELGGRVRTIHNTNTNPGLIETGAEFIHGKAPLTKSLLKKAGINFISVEGEFYRKERGVWKEQHEFIEGWDLLMKKMKKVKTDLTLKEFLEQEFAGYDYTNLRKQVRAFAEGFDIADISKVSTKSLYAEWSKGEEENYRIPNGYCALINYLKEECDKKGCNFILNSIVKQIDWEENEVTVTTSGGKKFVSEKVLVTVPLELLRRNATKASINFTPPVDEYIKATSCIGMGYVIKIVLQFKKAIWKPDTGFILTDEAIPTWWTQLPDKRFLLTGWAGGSRAEILSKESDKAILEKALISLAFIFETPLEDIRSTVLHSHVFNWQKNEFALGGYCYSMPESIEARKLLNTPLLNTLFFAGEALDAGTSPGTVEAALQSGKDVAARLRR